MGGIFSRPLTAAPTPPLLLKLIGVSLLLVPAPALAFNQVTKLAAESVCKPAAAPENPVSAWAGGLHLSERGLTPGSIPGARRITPAEAECLFAAYRAQMRFIAPKKMPKFAPMTYLILGGGAGGSYADPTQKLVERRLREITRGDLDAPLVSYCDDDHCFSAYNLALRAVRAGYRNIYWMRGGLSKWTAINLPTFDVDWNTWEADTAKERALFAEKAEADRVKAAQQDEDREAEILRERDRLRNAPAALLNKEYLVTARNSNPDESRTPLWAHSFRLTGSRGDRFKISVLSPGSSPAPVILGHPFRLDDRLAAKLVASWSSTASVMAPRKSATFELPADGSYYYQLEQAGVQRMANGSYRKADPEPYYITIEPSR